eukprot:6509423-Alexandrium_andersonii.AAC.1
MPAGLLSPNSPSISLGKAVCSTFTSRSSAGPAKWQQSLPWKAATAGTPNHCSSDRPGPPARLLASP